MIHIYNNCNLIVQKIVQKKSLTVTEQEDILRLPTNYLICYLDGFLDIVEQLKKAKTYIKNLANKTTYVKYNEALRIIRKVKYG